MSGGIEIKNLTQLKLALQKGAVYEVLDHWRKEKIGMLRVVHIVQKNAIYSVVKDDPEHPDSTCNYGKGLRLDFEKARQYEFGRTIRLYRKPVGSADNKLVIAFQILQSGEKAS